MAEQQAGPRIDISVGLDKFSEPFVELAPEDGRPMEITPDQAEQLAILLTRAASAARTRAGLFRSLLLTGMSVPETQQWLHDHARHLA